MSFEVPGSDITRQGDPGTSKDLALPNGVLIDLADTGQVALALDDLQQLKALVRSAEARLKEALLEHSAAIGKKTFDVPGVGKVEVKGGTSTVFDAQGLKRSLRDAGCPPERIAEIVRETVDYKVMAVEARRAAGANPAYAAAVEEHSTVVESNPTVTVKRIGGRRPAPGRMGEAHLTADAPPSPAGEEGHEHR